MNRKSNVRRRSRSLAGFASKSLCETVPKSLDPSERLSKLIELSFQYALSIAQKEALPSDFDINVFQQKGAETWDRIKNIVEENLIQSAVAENGNVSNSFACENVQEYCKTTEILEAESNKWNELSTNYRESLKRKMDSPYTVDTSIWKDKEQLYDYSEIIQSTSSIKDELSKQITLLNKYKTAYTESLHLNKTVNGMLVRKCQKYFKQNVTASPRTALRRLGASKNKTLTYQYVQ